MSARIAVIGGGPAGYVAALRAAQLGGDVTLIEESALGGTCLNRGCIPTKTFVRSADLLRDIQNAAKYGIIAGDPDIDYAEILRRKDGIVARLREGIAGLLNAAGVEHVAGKACFLGPNELLVRAAGGGERRLSAERFIIATGSRPSLPPVRGIVRAAPMTSDNVFDMPALPDRMLILGGGVIGVEFASVFTAFGVAVTIVEMMDSLLPTVDSELSRVLRKSLEQSGVTILLATKAESIDKKDGVYRLAVASNEGRKTLEAEEMLVSVGRAANIEGLGLDAARVAVDRGRIVVDEAMRTNVPYIFAAGDVNGGVQLAHTASREGEIAAEAAMGAPRQDKAKCFPSCIFTTPEIASVGMSEAEAERMGYQVKVGKFPFSANGKAMIEGETSGFVKVVADAANDRVLGVHIVGPCATVLISEGALAVENELTLHDLSKTIHAHPTLEEAIAEAALQANGIALHLQANRRSGKA